MILTPLEHWIMKKTGINEKSRNALEEYQLNKIKENLKYVKANSKFYKGHLKNVHEDIIQSFMDFQSIPFTFPHDIRKNPLDFLCVPQKDIRRIVTLSSSGTSGEEKRIFFTGEDIDLTIDFFKYGMRCLTDESDRVLVLLPGNSYGSIGDLLKRSLAMSNVECFVYGMLDTPEETARCIVERDITCIVGMPQQVLYLKRSKSEIFKSKIKKVLLSADYVPEIFIDELTHKCGCKVYTHYGMTEMGYGGGVECDALNGYHMRDGDLYFEIINPDSGRTVKDGEYGEVVFTTLTRLAMPLIRYRTGDIAAFSTETCTCGTFLKTMKRVLGRMDNGVELKKGQFLYLRELDEIVLSFGEVMDYKAYIDNVDTIFIKITTRNNEDFIKIKSEMIQSIQENLHKKFGYKINIELLMNKENKPDKIANSMIKRKIYDYNMH